jgi:hypothetical protein
MALSKVIALSTIAIAIVLALKGDSEKSDNFCYRKVGRAITTFIKGNKNYFAFSW